MFSGLDFSFDNSIKIQPLYLDELWKFKGAQDYNCLANGCLPRPGMVGSSLSLQVQHLTLAPERPPGLMPAASYGCSAAKMARWQCPLGLATIFGISTQLRALGLRSVVPQDSMLQAYTDSRRGFSKQHPRRSLGR